jgi:hypothetical protein
MTHTRKPGVYLGVHVGLVSNVRQVLPVSLNGLGSIDFMTGYMCRGGDSISFVCLSASDFVNYEFISISLGYRYDLIRFLLLSSLGPLVYLIPLYFVFFFTHFLLKHTCDLCILYSSKFKKKHIIVK